MNERAEICGWVEDGLFTSVFQCWQTAAFVVDVEGKPCEEGARVMRVHTVRDLGLEKCRDEVQ